MVFALAFLIVGKYIIANYPKPGCLLELAGLLCGVTRNGNPVAQDCHSGWFFFFLMDINY